MIEIETNIDGFTGKISNSLTINAKKGDRLVVSSEDWEVIQNKHKKWFKFIKEIKQEKKIEVSPTNKMITKYRNK